VSEIVLGVGRKASRKGSACYPVYPREGVNPRIYISQGPENPPTEIGLDLDAEKGLTAEHTEDAEAVLGSAMRL
jgi:hypothetical protein